LEAVLEDATGDALKSLLASCVTGFFFFSKQHGQLKIYIPNNTVLIGALIDNAEICIQKKGRMSRIR
jgi:hypothetical protein